jgi:glycosyltransferase involved in cell wall biosynthesis
MHPDDAWVKECPLPIHALGPARSGYAHSSRLVPWLRAHRARYDAVLVRGLWQFGGFGTWLALHNTTTPYFVFTHGMLDPWFKRTYPLKHLKKSLYWPWGEYRVLRDAQGVCFTCEEERVLARQSFSRYKCNEVVVNYGTARPPGDASTQQAAFLEQFPHLRSRRILLFLSRIHPKKGCDL